jgi:ABC-type multidrug transport system fused ATPase/permease subunit
VALECNLQLVQAVVLAMTTGLGGLLVLRGRMTLGDLTLLSVYTSQLLKPIEKLNDMAETTGRGLAGGERLVSLLQQSPAVVDDVRAASIGRARGVLELRNVWFAYPDRSRPVLRGVDLCAAPGSLTVLVGPSGAGKSTLFALLVRLADPTRGDIRLDGRPIRDLRLSSLRAQFAVLSQDTHVFAGTIRDALMPAGRVTRDEDLWPALALVSLESFVRQLPIGLDTPLGEDALNLSGGQRRRLALARAFLLDRPILLLDEPLANIDAESASIILQALDAIRPTTTCLATTPDRALADRADCVLRLDNGQVVAMPDTMRLATAVAR